YSLPSPPPPRPKMSGSSAWQKDSPYVSQEPRCARAGWREYGRSDGYRQIMSFCVQRWQDGSFLSQRRLERMHEIHALPRCTAPTVGVAAAAVTVVAAVVF